MSDTLTVMKLVGDSKNFVFSNLHILKDHAKIIFPMVLLLQLANNIAQATELKWVPLLTIIPILFLYGCFALSWHRTSLMGASSSHAINPLEWNKKDNGFMLLFFGLALVPMLCGVVIGAVFGGAYASGNTIVIGLAVIAVIAASIYAFLQIIRFSFKLPAKSVDVTLSMDDAKRASKGQIGKMIGAGVIIGLVYGATILLYGLVVALTVGMVVSGEEPTPMMTGIMTFLFGVPVTAAGFVLVALNVTVLSKAYQWGIQNNA